MTVPQGPEAWLQTILDTLGRIERRLDGFVTIPTHAADLRRLDDAVQNLTADLGQEKAERAQHVSEVRAEFVRALTEQRASIEQLTAGLAAEAEARRKGDEGDLNTIRGEIKGERDERRRDRQWLIGALIALLGVIVADQRAAQSRRIDALSLELARTRARVSSQARTIGRQEQAIRDLAEQVGQLGGRPVTGRGDDTGATQATRPRAQSTARSTASTPSPSPTTSSSRPKQPTTSSPKPTPTPARDDGPLGVCALLPLC